MYEDDRTASPSVQNAAHWGKKQKTVDTRAPGGESGNSPGNSTNHVPVYLSEGMLAGYSIHDPTRTPSQETAATAGTTPTTGGTMASSGHRPSLSPASAMPPSPMLVYNPHNVVGGNPAMYSHHHDNRDFGTPPTPTPGDPFAFHHEHPVVSSNPSAELKGSTFDGAAVQVDQQQLQAAAEAAAAAFATVDDQGSNDCASTGSPNPYNHDDTLPLL